MRRPSGALVLVHVLAMSAVARAGSGTPPTTEAAPVEEDGWPDLSAFLNERYGFLPIIVPITEPAVGYGAVGGVLFVSKPLGAARSGLGRPNITFVGGMGTENGSWGLFAADMRYWLDDRLQTLAGVAYATVNLDFHGLGASSPLEEDPLRYQLGPIAAAVQGRYRLGDTLVWAGLRYIFAVTEVSFEAPATDSILPDYDESSRVGGLGGIVSYDSRDNVFTPTAGTYLEASLNVFGRALGGEDSFERLGLVAIAYVPLLRSLFFGVRADAAASFGDAPFYLEPFVGLRGVPVMRYQGETLAQAEAELRWQFYKRFSVLGFAGAGAVWSGLERVDDPRHVFAGGAGFRYEIARAYGLHMGVDLAFSSDTTAIYLQVGSAWARP